MTDGAHRLSGVDLSRLRGHVQSIYPGWKFSAPDTIAANGLHGKLLIGPRHAIAPRRTQWIRQLSAFEIDLFCDGELLQRRWRSGTRQSA